MVYVQKKKNHGISLFSVCVVTVNHYFYKNKNGPINQFKSVSYGFLIQFTTFLSHHFLFIVSNVLFIKNNSESHKIGDPVLLSIKSAKNALTNMFHFLCSGLYISCAV